MDVRLISYLTHWCTFPNEYRTGLRASFKSRSKVLGFNVATPVFDGADENDIMDTLEMANDYANKTWEEFLKNAGVQG